MLGHQEITFLNIQNSITITIRILGHQAITFLNIQKYIRPISGEHPSRVEVVSTIIVKSVKAALNAKSGIDKPIAISHNVNVRRKAMPPFPDYLLGNFIWPMEAISREKKTELSSLVYDLRTAIRKVDSEFVQDAIEGGSSKLFRHLKEKGNSRSVDEVELMEMNRWCNFGVYNNLNFGWGKPVWISIGNICVSEEMIPVINMSNLIDTVSGDGVEAWLYLPRDIAAALEKDGELLQYASFNVPPLGIVAVTNHAKDQAICYLDNYVPMSKL